MSLITTTKDLKSLCAGLKKAEFITVDTEFIRERTYWARLCLIQVAGPDDAFAIDPLAEDIDLSPFYDLMNDKNITKVFHACRQDLEIFFKATGKLPAPVFDTQIAAMVCGFGEQVSYENLVGTLIKKTLDKSSRFTDWAQRPLTSKQLKYALADVIHLRPIYEKLTDQLEKQGRKTWIRDELKDLLDKDNYIVRPEELWMRIRLPSNKPRALGVLREIAAWREVAAQHVDIPRGRMLKDEALAEIALHPPKTKDDLARMRGVHRGFAESEKGAELLQAVQRGMDAPEDSLPKRERGAPSPAGFGPAADLLRVLLKMKCAEHKVAQKLVCSADDLDRLAAEGENAEIPALKGWRRKMFGNEALSLRDGKLAIAVVDGKVKLVKAD